MSDMFFEMKKVYHDLVQNGRDKEAQRVLEAIAAHRQKEAEKDREQKMGFPIRRTTVAAVGGGGAGASSSGGQQPPRMSIHERAEAKLCARMDWMLLTDAGIHIHIHALQDKVFIFGVKDGNHFVLEDTSGMFPSDTTVTQLRMVCDGRQQD